MSACTQLGACSSNEDTACLTVSNLTDEEVKLQSQNKTGTVFCASIKSKQTESFGVPLHLEWEVVGQTSKRTLQSGVLVNVSTSINLAPSHVNTDDVPDFQCGHNWLLSASIWAASFTASAYLEHGVPLFVTDPEACKKEFTDDPTFCEQLADASSQSSFMTSPLFYTAVGGAAVMVALWALTQGPFASVTCTECHGRGWRWTGGMLCRYFGWCDCRSVVLENRCAYWAAKTGKPYQWNSENADAQSGNFRCACCSADDPTDCVDCSHLSGAMCRSCALN